VTLDTQKRLDERGASINDERRFQGSAIEMSESAKSFECPFCHKLQFIGDVKQGSVIETKCTRRSCKRFMRFRVM